MKMIKQYLNVALALGFVLFAASCSKDDNGDDNGNNDPIIEGNETYVLGVGVTVGDESTNYVVHTKDLLNGNISLLNNGILQEGYREYINIGNYFYAIGGLGLTGVDAYYLNAENRLTAKKGLVFEHGADDYLSVDDGKTLLGVTVDRDEASGYEGNVEFFTVDVDGYEITKKTVLPVKEVYEAENKDHGWSHSGIVVRGDQAFQTVFPISSSYETPNVNTNYVAVYSYPDFQLQKVITDTRTGPSGAPLTRSGIFVTESGDIYTLFHGGYGFDQKQSLKDPAILRIKAGEDEFDQDYYFKTDGVPDGGKIIKATYVGNNKLLAQIYTKEPTNQWDQTDLKYAIVDLVKKDITAVQNSPIYTYCEEAFVDGDKAYLPAKVGTSLNIYEVDIPTAIATKGIQIDATYVKNIGKLRK